MKQELLHQPGPDINGTGTSTVIGLSGWNRQEGGPKESKLIQGPGLGVLSQEHWMGSLGTQLPPALQGLQAQTT